MKLLQILVWLLLFVLTYDLATYYLTLRSEGEVLSKGGGRNRTYGYESLAQGIGVLSQWAVVGACLLCLFLVRLIFRRHLPQDGDILRQLQKEAQDHAKIRRRESYLTCKMSETSSNSYIDDHNFDPTGQLSVEQLQVLLEELKFSVDEKFEGIEAWIESNEQESKLWIKRLERAETELTYIHHQIFILMNNARLGSSISLGDKPDTREHVETLRDLSIILAQVKKQFEDTEENGVLKEQCALEENNTVPNLVTIREVKEDENGGPDNEEIELKEEFNFDFSEVKSKENSSGNLSPCDSPSVERNASKEDFLVNSGEFRDPDYSITNDDQITSRKGVDSPVSSTTSDRPITPAYGKEVGDCYRLNAAEIWACPAPLNIEPKTKSLRISVENLGHCVAESQNKPLYSFEKGDSTSLAHTNVNEIPAQQHQEAMNLAPSKEYSNNIIIDCPVRKSNIVSTPHYSKESTQQVRKDIPERAASPKRSVRFAQDKRDLSPSKTPTWFGVRRDKSPGKHLDLKGNSDSKVSSFTGDTGRGKQESSSSCPLTEDRRESRRTILERQLTNLERKASPTRLNRNKITNVRSKVADYIKGNR